MAKYLNLPMQRSVAEHCAKGKIQKKCARRLYNTF